MYDVFLTKKAKKQLAALSDIHIELIVNFLSKPELAINPALIGTTLKGEDTDYWRYHLGQYRILAFSDDDKLIINAIQKNRKETCKKIYKTALVS